jgi:hypothetical protein
VLAEHDGQESVEIRIRPIDDIFIALDEADSLGTRKVGRDVIVLSIGCISENIVAIGFNCVFPLQN